MTPNITATKIGHRMLRYDKEKEQRQLLPIDICRIHTQKAAADPACVINDTTTYPISLIHALLWQVLRQIIVQ